MSSERSFWGLGCGPPAWVACAGSAGSDVITDAKLEGSEFLHLFSSLDDEAADEPGIIDVSSIRITQGSPDYFFDDDDCDHPLPSSEEYTDADAADEETHIDPVRRAAKFHRADVPMATSILTDS